MRHYKLELLDKEYTVILSSCSEGIASEDALFSINAPLIGASIRHMALSALLTSLFGETNRRLKRIRNPLYRFLAVLFGIHQIHKLVEVTEREYETVRILVFEGRPPMNIKCRVSQVRCLRALNYVDIMRGVGIELSDTVTSSCQLLERYALTRSATFAGIGRL